MELYSDLFNEIASLENLVSAWEAFKLGKQSKTDVMEFEWRLEENLFDLHRELERGTYRHSPYEAFYIQDPKQRLIHKATVRDRVLHHSVFKILNPIFEPTFIANSFSCREGKGTHKGVRVLADILRKVSQNHTGPCFGLKFDIYKFFASVDHRILLAVLKRRIQDKRTIRLLKGIIDSFVTQCARSSGLPIGNLTSQLFANVYMNELDQFIKHKLKVRHYVRYTDDFIVVSDSVDYLNSLLPEIEKFLATNLRLRLHPNKISIRKFSQGVDFLGYVILPHHILLRTKTRRRLERKLSQRTAQYAIGIISQESFNQTWQSYKGTLSHANSYKLSQKIGKIIV